MWKPNRQRKRIYSEIMDKMIQLSVTTYTLREIDKAKGLDNYILNTHPQKLLSNKAMELRAELLAVQAAKQAKAAKESVWDVAKGGEDGVLGGGGAAP